MGPGVRVSQLMNILFDLAAWVSDYSNMTFLPKLMRLFSGDFRKHEGKTSKEWRSVMKLVDVIIATTSMLMPHDPADYPNTKVVAVAGEPCPKSKYVYEVCPSF